MTTDDFSVIEPLVIDVEFAGKTRKVSPLKVGQLPRFARALNGVSVNLDGLANFDPEALFAVLADHGDAIIEAISAGTGIDTAEIQSADPDELIALAAAVMRVNTDFFVRRLVPALKQATAQVAGAGQTPSTP